MTIKALTDPIFLSKDLASILGPRGIHEINHILWVSYKDFRKNLTVEQLKNLKNCEEDTITADWFLVIQKIWSELDRASIIKVNNLSPTQQHPDATHKKTKKSPSIDLCFRTFDIPVDNSKYIGIECKKLNEKNNYQIKRYCEKGINHYISGYYGSKSNINFMVGYLHSGSISTIKDKINKQMKIVSDPNANLIRDSKILEPQYISKHENNHGTKIVIKHLLLDFVAPSN